MNDVSYGMWAGLGVDNTAEAVAAGALYSDAAGKVAVLAKTTRNAMMDSLSWRTLFTGLGKAKPKPSQTKLLSYGRSFQSLSLVFS